MTRSGLSLVGLIALRPATTRPACAALCGILGILFLAVPAQPAHADAQDTFSVVPALTVMHDDNLFRLPANASPSADTIRVASLALKVNKPYSLQRFELEASLVDYDYQNNQYLSYRTVPYKAAWRWMLTPRLHGSLSSDHSESLNSFADYTGYTVRNTNIKENTRFDVVADLSGSWHLLGGLSESTTTNSQFTLGEGDNSVKRAELGVRYTLPSGSTFSYIARSGRGDYFNRAQPIASAWLDNSFDDLENEVRLVWPITAKANIDARLAHLGRSHAHFAERDYDGAVGNLNFTWNMSGKSFLMASVARELASYQTSTSNYTATDRLSLTPYWQFSDKTALRFKFDYARRDYLGRPSIVPASNRSDTLRSTMIALEWQPMRNLVATASLQNDKRASSMSGLDFDSTTLGVSAQMTF